MKRWLCIGLLINPFLSPLSAQQEGAVDAYLSYVISQEGEENFDETLLEEIEEELEGYLTEPLNLYVATEEELWNLFFSEQQIESLLKYREINKEQSMYYDLVALEGFNSTFLHLLSPFAEMQPIVSMEKRKRRLRGNIHYRLWGDLVESKGFRERKFAGGPVGHILRTKWYLGQSTEIGIVARSDPGETIFRGANRYGYDLQHFYATTRWGRFTRILLGNYRLRFGQGLMQWSGFTPSVSSDVIAVLRSSDVFTPNRSSSANSGLQGGAFTWVFGNWSFSSAFSWQRRDGRLDSINNQKVVSSTDLLGYHRTSSEIEKKGTFQERFMALHVRRHGNFGQLEAMWTVEDLEYPIIGKPRPGELSGFQGRLTSLLGAHYKFNFRRLLLFSEGAYSFHSQGAAWTGGLLARSNGYIKVSILARVTDRHFHSRKSSFYSVQKQRGEQGLYLGISFYPLPIGSIDAYIDYYRRPFQTSLSGEVDYGFRSVIQLNLPLHSSYQILFRHYFRHSIEEREGDNHKFRGQIEWQLNEAWSFRDRVEVSLNPSTEQSGYMFYHDSKYRVRQFPLKIVGRVAWFHTDDFTNTRFFAYENDLRYSFSIRQYYSHGIRSYLLFQFHWAKSWKVGFRIAHTLFFDRAHYSSGYNETETPFQTQLKGDIIYSLP